MDTKKVIWLPVVRGKLQQFRSDHFTAEETLEFISELIIEIEVFLKSFGFITKKIKAT